MRVLENVSQTFWEEVARNSPDATFFHTPYWSKLMEKTYSCIDITKGFIFDDGTRVVFPFMRRKRKRLKALLVLNDYISGMLNKYGGPIADREMNEQQLAEIIEYISSKFKMYNSILIRANPYGKVIKPIGFKEVKDFSHVVELFKCKDEEDLFNIYSKHSKIYIKRAKKSNMLIKESTSLDDYEWLYQLYKKSFKYWGESILTNYPLVLFQNLYNLKCKFIRFWVTYYKNKFIGGTIKLFWNDYCTSFCSYHDREYSIFQERRYLEHNIFLDCIEKGIKYHDYLQSGGMKGIEYYKKSMGAVEYHHSSWLKENKYLKKIGYVKNNI